MPTTPCCIPDCHWSQIKDKTHGVIRTFFTIRRPDLAKPADDEAHTEALHKFILAMRDPTKRGRNKKAIKQRNVRTFLNTF